MLPHRKDNWEDLDNSKFEGWPKNETDDAKIKLYQRVIHAYKQEIKVHQNTLNFLKNKIYTTLEKLYLETKIENAINNIPCFTTNLIEAAEFISEYAHDSDDDTSEVISIDGDHDTVSVFSEEASSSSPLPIQIPDNEKDINLNCHLVHHSVDNNSQVPENYPLNESPNECLSNANGFSIPVYDIASEGLFNREEDEHFMDCHEPSTINEKSSEMSENCLSKFHSNESVSNSDDFSKHHGITTSIVNSNHKEEIASLDVMSHDISLTQNIDPEAIQNTIDQAVLDRNNCNNKIALVRLPRIDPPLAKSPSSCKKGTIEVEEESDTQKICLPITRSARSQPQIKEQLSRKRKHNAENKTEKRKKSYEPNNESCNLLRIQNSNLCEVQFSSTLERSFICDYCKRAFISKPTLRRHIMICSKRNDGWRPKPKVKSKQSNTSFQCKSCKMSYKTKGSLDRHNEKIHNLIKRFQCSVCRWTFYNNEALHYHCITRHGLSKQNIYACAFCNCKFKKIGELRYHSRCKHGSKLSHVCFVCFKSFISEALLKKHKREHGMSCEICSFRTSTKRELNDHVLSHVQTVIYNCEICSRVFTRRNDFKHHIKTHWMERRDDGTR